MGECLRRHSLWSENLRRHDTSRTLKDPRRTLKDPRGTPEDPEGLQIGASNSADTLFGPSISADMTRRGASMTPEGPSRTLKDPRRSLKDPKRTLNELWHKLNLAGGHNLFALENPDRPLNIN